VTAREAIKCALARDRPSNLESSCATFPVRGATHRYRRHLDRDTGTDPTPALRTGSSRKPPRPFRARQVTPQHQDNEGFREREVPDFGQRNVVFDFPEGPEKSGV
jgi:hypothetical protein